FFFSSRRRHTRLVSDWSSDVCSSDLSLTRIVSLARLAIGDRDGGAQLVRTLPRVGYRFEGAVQECVGRGEESAAARSPQRAAARSEERRVGKGGGGRWGAWA